MGTDKAFIQFGGIPLIERALATLRKVCSQVTVVGEPSKFAKWGQVVEDVYSGRGPLAGIHAALLHSTAELNLILAVDMPFVSEELLNFLLATAESGTDMVAVPRTARGLQPLCAVYRRSFAQAAEQALLAGRNKIDAVFSRVSTRVIHPDELLAAGFTERAFVNMNVPEDLQVYPADLMRS